MNSVHHEQNAGEVGTPLRATAPETINQLGKIEPTTSARHDTRTCLRASDVAGHSKYGNVAPTGSLICRIECIRSYRGEYVVVATATVLMWPCLALGRAGVLYHRAIRVGRGPRGYGIRRFTHATSKVVRRGPPGSFCPTRSNAENSLAHRGLSTPGLLPLGLWCSARFLRRFGASASSALVPVRRALTRARVSCRRAGSPAGSGR
jgi:hypothetical protein